jgi:hypothetical protein
MAKKTSPKDAQSADQVENQAPEQAMEQLETPSAEQSEEILQAPSPELNTPKAEPEQVGHGSRDFGREPKVYQAPVETPSITTEDGGQKEDEV